jgi:hypothetical protein
MLEHVQHGGDRLATQVRKRPYYRVVDLGEHRPRLVHRQRDLEQCGDDDARHKPASARRNVPWQGRWLPGWPAPFAEWCGGNDWGNRLRCGRGGSYLAHRSGPVAR